jgi:hypothetical protein
MLRITKLSPLSLLVLTLAACSSGSGASPGTPMVVTDTLGWKFDVSCSSGLCVLSPHNANLLPKSCESGSGVDTFILVPDPLLSVFAALVPASGLVQLSAAEPSRPVACESDTDCLPAGMVAPGASYACTNRLCQCSSAACASNGQNGNPLVYDVLTLCQADLPWPTPTQCPHITSQPYASRIDEVASVCSGGSCTSVPADCLQLTPAAPADGGAQSTPIDGSAQSTAIDGGAQSAPVDSSVDSGL